MNIETLRKPRIGPFAIFDFASAFAGAWFLAPRVGVPRSVALLAVVLVGVLVHKALGIDTPLSQVLSPRMAPRNDSTKRFG